MKKLIPNKNSKYSKKRKIQSDFSFLDWIKNINILLTIKILVVFIICILINFEKSHTVKKEIILKSNNYEILNKMKNKETDNFIIKLLQQISIIKHIFSRNVENYKKEKNIIHIVFSANNDGNYKYIMFVSMYSLLTNCDKNKTFVTIHLLCIPKFKKLSARIFLPLVKQFSQNVEIILYNMGNLINNRENERYTQSTYYKLLTPIFIDSDRIIYLDADTLVFSDLNEMYNLDFNDNYILGEYDYLVNNVDYLGIKSQIYINAGVILFNLKKIRDDKKVYEFLNLTNSDILFKDPDQTIINYVLHPKIGRIPSKYVIFNFEDKLDLAKYNNYLRTKIPIEELEEALKNPTIIHFILCKPKPWFIKTAYRLYFSACARRLNCSCKKYFDLWHSYAKQTDYYEIISKFTGVKNKANIRNINK